MSAVSTRALLPKTAWTVSRATPARSAMSFIVVRA